MEINFIADDFGMNASVNEAIVHAHRKGVLQGAALMMGQTGTVEAVALARAHPSLRIGVHFHLADSMPLTIPHWPWGDSPARAGISFSTSREAAELMRREIERQWELFQRTELPCDFVNTHHHLHAHPAVFKTLLEVLGPDFKGWIRLGKIHFFKQETPIWSSAGLVNVMFRRARKLSTRRTSDTLWGLDRLGAMRSREILDAMANLQEGSHEFLFHPRNLSCPDTRCLLELKTFLSQ